MYTSRICPNCGRIITANDVFCPYCGRKLTASTKCPVCGNEMNGAKFCSKCGYSAARNNGEIKGKISANAKKSASSAAAFVKKHKKIFIIVAAIIALLIVVIPVSVTLASPYRAAKVNKVELESATKADIEKKFGTPTYEYTMATLGTARMLAATEFIKNGNLIWVYYEDGISKKLKDLDKKFETAEDFDDLEKLDKEYDNLAKKAFKSIVVAFDGNENVSFIALNTKTKYDDSDLFATTAKKELKSVELSKNTVAINSIVSENKIIYTAKFKDGSMLKSYVGQAQGYDSAKEGVQKITFSDGWAEYSKNIEVKAHNVSVSANLKGISVSGKGYYENGEQVTVTAPGTYGENYEFYAWSNGNSKISTETSYTFTYEGTPITLTALYKDKRFTYSDSGNTITGIKDKTVTSIVIPDDITTISERAFYNCAELTSVTIPDSVTSIGGSAFSGCSSLESITIPFVGAEAGKTSSDTYQYPFGYIFGTSSYTGGTATKQYYYGSSTSSTTYDTYYIPSSLKSVTVTGGNILYGAFYGCSGLTSVTIPDSVTSIGYAAFYHCSGLTSITIPDSVTSIGDSAFGGCTGLTSVTIPDSVTSIGSYAFYNCTGLTSITIPDSVTNIGEDAFYNCTGLTSITIPDSVTSIGGSAFYNCPIETATIPAFACYYVKNASLKTVIITSGESIGDWAFYNCDGLTSVTIPDSVTSIGDSAFSGCTGLTSITIPDMTSIGNSAFYNCTGLTSITIPDMTSIGNSAFYNCPIETATIPAFACSDVKNASLKTVIITSGESIGHRAFWGCSSLTSVTIPDSVTNIGEDAFYNCTGLTSVTIPDSVTSIGSYAFYNCTGLTSIEVANGNTKYHSNGNCLIETKTKTLILGCKTSVIPADGSVTSIGDWAFYNCDGLTSVTIPDSVKSIGSYAFYNCPIETATIPAFACSEVKNASLKTVIITSGESIGNSAFRGCSSLTSVTIGNGVTSIGNSAFWGCSSLTSVTIGNGVTSIGYEAFYNCSNLTSITIPDSVTSIDDWAFYNCDGLTSVTIPDSVKSIGYCAFRGCSGLTSINYNGTKAQWSAISKAPEWNFGTGDYKIHCTDGDIAK